MDVSTPISLFLPMPTMDLKMAIQRLYLFLESAASPQPPQFPFLAFPS